MSTHRPIREYRCVDVIDGDTVILKRGAKFFKVRLAFIDAPESEQLAFSGEHIGLMATKFLSSLIKGKKVWFIMHAKDIYGRYVGEIIKNQVSINLKMVRAGMAIPYYYKTKGHYRSSFSRAYEKRLGIWATAGMLNPRVYRKQKKEQK